MRGADDLRALQEIQDEMVEAKLIKPPTDATFAVKGKTKAAKAEKKKKAKGSGVGKTGEFRVYEAPSGLQVLIGRNNKQNDEISMRIANGAKLCCLHGTVPVPTAPMLGGRQR